MARKQQVRQPPKEAETMEELTRVGGGVCMRRRLVSELSPDAEEIMGQVSSWGIDTLSGLGGPLCASMRISLLI